jgi:hypothetical protein
MMGLAIGLGDNTKAQWTRQNIYSSIKSLSNEGSTTFKKVLFWCCC